MQESSNKRELIQHLSIHRNTPVYNNILKYIELECDAWLDLYIHATSAEDRANYQGRVQALKQIVRDLDTLKLKKGTAK